VEAMLAVRMDQMKKEQGTAILARLGYTPSAAVRRLFDYVVKFEALPFEEHARISDEEMRARIAAFDECQLAAPLRCSDEEIRDLRLGERYGSRS